MEFVKMAEGNGLEVYQAMRRVDREPFLDEDGAPVPSAASPHVLAPFLPEVVTEKLVRSALSDFAHRQVEAISVSTTGGVSVRVLPRLCRSCGAALSDEHRYCPSCGTDSQQEEAS